MDLKRFIIYALMCCAYHCSGFILILQRRADKTLDMEPGERLTLKTPENIFLVQQGVKNIGSQTSYHFGQNNDNTIIDKVEAYNVNIDAAFDKNLTSNHKSLADRLLNSFQQKNPNAQTYNADPQINLQASAVKISDPSPHQPGEANVKSNNNYIISLNAGSALDNNTWRTEKEVFQNQINMKLERIRDEITQSMRTLLAEAIAKNFRMTEKENASDDESVEDDAL